MWSQRIEPSSRYHARIVWVVCHALLVSVSLSVSRAARAKLQRLERENHQLEKTVATLRHAQAKAEELEKANKKLHGGAHDSRREIIKLKGVGVVWLWIGYTYIRKYVCMYICIRQYVYTGTSICMCIHVYMYMD